MLVMNCMAYAGAEEFSVSVTSEKGGTSWLNLVTSPAGASLSLHGLSEAHLRQIRDAIDARLVELRPKVNLLPELPPGVGFPGLIQIEELE